MTVVLGLDTATADAAVAVTGGGEVIREVAVPPDQSGRPRHSQALLPEVDRCVDSAGGWKAIELIAIGVGPGSFTGLRIGIATARALAQARRIPLAPVVTLAALARAISAHPLAEDRSALPVIDARRGEAFAALYALDGSELRPPLVASPAGIAALVAELDSAPLAAGDGALRFAAELEAGGATVAPPQDPVHRVAARHVCGLGAAAPEAAPGEIEPRYLRPPDAKRWLERDRGRSG
ncbi:MAG TPA: tRNA (adenosine(37)-N6)-threonylcarbamoyltransferase complex dimerization subunit type 1 TsaB [Solirubrobacterales bacterium]|nr:tRNA (adenosine(37)-N6)-threonylcarbamoyltransferase complex dimerization subunit type 1 TsaB [Solirubrobacterales bacterium]